MRRIAPWLVIVAFLASIAYAVTPGPYTMGAFAFVALPLYVLGVLTYLGVVIRDLRGKVL